MVRSRILWGLWLVFCLVLCMASDSEAAYLLLIVSVVLPVGSMLLSGIPAGKITCELSFSAYGQKGQAVSGTVTAENKSLLPADRLMVRVQCENLLTGEKVTVPVRLSLPAKGRVQAPVKFRSIHCGEIRLLSERLLLFDWFGLRKIRRSIRGAQPCYVLAAPEPFPVETEVAYGENADMDSDEYSMKRAGYDPSETFAIREYQPGDRIRQIHWKLTEKMDTLMVRDYGLPIQNTILLLLETGYSEQTKVAPACLDTLAEAVISVSQSLLDRQMVHSLGWQNHEEHLFSMEEIETEEELQGILPGLLSAVPGEDPVSVLEHYLETREQLEFAHVVLFTTEHRPSLSYLADQCLITEVICGPGRAGYDKEDGISIVGIDPESPQELLAYLEL